MRHDSPVTPDLFSAEARTGRLPAIYRAVSIHHVREVVYVSSARSPGTVIVLNCLTNGCPPVELYTKCHPVGTGRPASLRLQKALASNREDGCLCSASNIWRSYLCFALRERLRKSNKIRKKTSLRLSKCQSKDKVHISLHEPFIARFYFAFYLFLCKTFHLQEPCR